MMTPVRIRWFHSAVRGIALIVLATSSVALAQDQTPAQPASPSSGGWRRVADAQTSKPSLDAQDPTQPVDRSEAQALRSDQNAAPPPAEPQPYGLPPRLTLKAGTFVTVRMDEALSSDRNQVGDMFSATLMQPIVVDGVIVAERGQIAYGRVVEARKAGRVEGVSRLGLQLTGLTLVDGEQAPIQSALYNRAGRTTVGNDVAAVGTTTAIGAAVGAAADWGRGAAIGAGAGAAVGLVGVLLTRGHPTVIYPETALTFRLESPVTIITTHAPQAFRYVGPEDYERPVAEARPRPAYRRYGYSYPPPPYYYGPAFYPYYYPYPYWSPFYTPGFSIFVGGGRFRRFR